MECLIGDANRFIICIDLFGHEDMTNKPSSLCHCAKHLGVPLCASRQDLLPVSSNNSDDNHYIVLICDLDENVLTGVGLKHALYKPTRFPEYQVKREGESERDRGRERERKRQRDCANGEVMVCFRGVSLCACQVGPQHA